MDNSAFPPIFPPSVEPKSNLPKILFILIPLLIVAVLIGIIFITKPFNLFQSNKLITTSTKNPVISNIPIKVQESSPSSKEGIKSYPKYNMIGFNGQITEKGKDYLVLTGGNKTIKIKINNEVKIYMINKSEFLKNPNPYLSKLPGIIPFSEVKIGSNIRVLGKGNENLLNIVFIGIFL